MKGVLTTLYLQGAVLLIQGISSQVHHTCSCGSYPGNICDVTCLIHGMILVLLDLADISC